MHFYKKGVAFCFRRIEIIFRTVKYHVTLLDNTCKLCDPGYYRDDDSDPSSRCKICQAGIYCPAGGWSNNPASQGSSAGVCPKGNFLYTIHIRNFHNLIWLCVKIMAEEMFSRFKLLSYTTLLHN